MARIIKLEGWLPTGEQVTVQGRTWRELEEDADSQGVIRIKDLDGGILRKLFGEWIWIK